MIGTKALECGRIVCRLLPEMGTDDRWTDYTDGLREDLVISVQIRKTCLHFNVGY